MNRTARRTAAAGVALAAVMGGLVAVAPSATAATPCQSDCISSITATPYPDGLRLAVATSSPTLVSADIYFGTTKVKSFAPAAGSALTSTRTYEMATGLSQGVWYRYVVKAADSFGNVRTEEGTLRTSRRDLKVTFDKVALSDDSDSTNAGDFYWMGSKVGSSELGAYKLLGATDTYWYWNSGGTYSVPSTARTHSIVGAQQNRPLKFTMWDDDNDVFGGGYICMSGAPTCVPSFTNGSDDTADWSTATGTLALPTTTGSSSGTFSIGTPAGAAVRFSVAGSWSQTVKNIASAPRSFAATPYNGSVLLGWAAPATSNGASVLGYRVTSSTGGTWNLPANARSLSVSGLTNNVPVTFSIVAVNSEGDSPAAKVTGTPIAVPTKIATVNASAGNAKVTVSWSPAAGEGTTHYRVYVGGVLRSDTTLTSVTVAATNGVAVDVKVTPYNALGNGPTSTYPGKVTPYAPTSISGWNPNAMSGAYGTSWTTTLTVTSGGQSGRPVELQRRLRGATNWATYGTYATTMAGTVPVSIPFATGIWEWRAYAPAWKTYGAATTVVKQMSRTTVISGWSTLTSSYATGWTVLDGITVTPGQGREVILIGSKAGSGTWSILGRWNADSNGNVSVPIKVQAGTWQYSVIVEERYEFGAATSTPTRTITGT